MKARTGSIVKRKPRRKGAKSTWWARVTYIEKADKRHDLQRRGESKANARDLLQALLREIEATEGQALRNERNRLVNIRAFHTKTMKECGRVPGHSQANTTYRYNANAETAKRAAADLNAFNAGMQETVTAAELMHSG